jgi:hypothetical protein
MAVEEAFQRKRSLVAGALARRVFGMARQGDEPGDGGLRNATVSSLLDK